MIQLNAKLTSKTVHGFDSFEGLPDDGIIPNFKDDSIKWYKGKMNNHGILPKFWKMLFCIKAGLIKLYHFLESERKNINYAY